MILSVHQRFEFDLPTHWRELPPASVLETSDWLFEWVEEIRVPSHHRATLLESLGQAASFATTKMSLGQAWIAIIDPQLGRVRAVASIGTVDLADVAFPGREGECPSTFPIDGVLPWASQNSVATLAGHPAIVVHDFIAYTLKHTSVISERYTGTVFPDAGAVAVQLEILAADGDAFVDIVADGNAILGGLRFSTDSDE